MVRQTPAALLWAGVLGAALNVLPAGPALAGPSLSVAPSTPWLVRVRAVSMDMANKSEPIAALGVPADAIHIEDKIIPEVDISYFFTPNWAAELVLTVPQKHEVSIVNGSTTSLGSFKHLPPTLSLQYHFRPGATVQPYVSAGVNYTKIISTKLSAGPGLPLTLENGSIGPSVGAGIDIPFGKNRVFNVDIKKMQIRSDVMLNGQKISAVKADPVLIGIGVGWKF